MKATGWQQHSVRGFFAGAKPRRRDSKQTRVLEMLQRQQGAHHRSVGKLLRDGLIQKGSTTVAVWTK